MAQSIKGKRTMVSIQSNLLLEELPSKAKESLLPQWFNFGVPSPRRVA